MKKPRISIRAFLVLCLLLGAVGVPWAWNRWVEWSTQQRRLEIRRTVAELKSLFRNSPNDVPRLQDGKMRSSPADDRWFRRVTELGGVLIDLSGSSALNHSSDDCFFFIVSTQVGKDALERATSRIEEAIAPSGAITFDPRTGTVFVRGDSSVIAATFAMLERFIGDNRQASANEKAAEIEELESELAELQTEVKRSRSWQDMFGGGNLIKGRGMISGPFSTGSVTRQLEKRAGEISDRLEKLTGMRPSLPVPRPNPVPVETF